MSLHHEVAALDPVHHLKDPTWVSGEREPRYSPLARTAAIVLLILLISLPWFLGITWLGWLLFGAAADLSQVEDVISMADLQNCTCGGQ